ncbi:bifunctional isochorismate lyase / aryl carrier protein [Methylobacillus rhizosphaerae]|uniref:isochorismatase n=1 Tax=Methylobacillus rhizosphaerae TaxID=551994 RepID=A0A238YXQ1_9PROT|nr:isochorismatase family protein [Methylobacillus rhizosphaerae]SNR75877.1 bifunctional isochorismate lyase / aryl carrier protein [Methylobacillus rhizosphaerae]
MAIPRIPSYNIPETFPDNRVAWQASRDRAVLLVHDMQDYFLDFYDRDSKPVPQLQANIRSLIDLAHSLEIPVVYTAQLPEQNVQERGLLQDMWGPGLTAQPQGKSIVAALAPETQDTVLDKWRYSAFQKSTLEKMMREDGRDQLIICGIYAHIGCMMTACDAFMRDIQAFMVADAVADFSTEEHAMALRYVAQRCGAVTTTEALLAVLQPASSHNHVPLSQDELKTTIAGLLQVPAAELQPDDNLLDWGLDSIRIMSLLESWRKTGLDLSFMRLAEQPTLAAWWSILDPDPAHS